MLADGRGDIQAVLQKARGRFFCGHTKGIKKPVPLRLLGVFAVDFQCLDHTLFRKGQLAIPLSTKNEKPGEHMKKADFEKKKVSNISKRFR